MAKVDFIKDLKGKNKHANLQENLLNLVDGIIAEGEATPDQMAKLARFRAYIIINLEGF